ncbi:STM3941 family protein [Nocardia mangyaensis]|nr:STM3941 family protein [Nocardia mangyaensis]
MSSGGVPRPATYYYPSVLYLVGMIAGAAALVAGGIWVVLSGDAPLFPLVASVLGVPFFTCAGVFLAARLILRKPELVLTDDGLVHRQYGRIGWDEVTHARIQTVRTSAFSHARFLQLGLHDPDAFYARSSRWLRLMAKANRRLGYGQANLAGSTLGAPLEQVLNAMRTYRPGLVILE